MDEKYNASNDIEVTEVESTREVLTLARSYRPANDEEKALDKSLNLKLDCIVIATCAINFLVGPLGAPPNSLDTDLACRCKDLTNPTSATQQQHKHSYQMLTWDLMTLRIPSLFSRLPLSHYSRYQRLCHAGSAPSTGFPS